MFDFEDIVYDGGRPLAHGDHPFRISPRHSVSEGAMQAAGRQSSHTYRDLRSASRAYRRTHNYPKRSHNTSVCRSCHDISYNSARLARKKDVHNTLSQWHETYQTDVEAESDCGYSNLYLDDVAYRERFGIWRPGARLDEEAEDFGAWARRRVNEMRAVKEERLRQAQSENHTNSVATTLPTTPEDCTAHALLASMLTLSKRQTQYFRSKHRPLLPSIRGFAWFGEFEYAWHRNASGCWEFGYADCGWCVFPHSCCGIAYARCSCREFTDGEGRWKGPAPEERQGCALVEWVSGELWDVLVEEERRVEGLRDMFEGEMGDDWSEEWDVMSDGVSEGWSVVSEEEEFEVI
ncbi:hypothetical protein EK21DRAFT_112807 [Setomelanomma holmii]|uniref:Uncharacterized protein n=1 Tax=Setomelanomma holmii TaxID=210430 RepID=A0A9P4LME4_9PLEO|nr:hypothetical protein EK21DRAFT_112807 [Setomelanomma holmii]